MTVRLSLDGCLIYVGCYIVTAPVVLVGLNSQPEVQQAPILPFAMALLAAVPVTWFYRRAGKSLGDLGMFIFVTAALNVIFGLLLTIAFGSFGAETVPIPTITVVFLATMYAIGYYLVYRNGCARLKSTFVEFV